MSNETESKTKPNVQDQKEPTAFGIPFSQIPAAPWTLEALGHNCYLALAKLGAYGEPENGRYPDLDPRSFAYGIAYKRVVRLLPMPFITNPSRRAQSIVNVLAKKEDAKKYCQSEQDYAEIQMILSEYEKLNAYLETFFGAGLGTPDNPSIPAPKTNNAKVR